MWEYNKAAILSLLSGLVLLSGVSLYLRFGAGEELLSRQVMAVGVCVLLFAVATTSWVSTRRNLRRRPDVVQLPPRSDEEDKEAE